MKEDSSSILSLMRRFANEGSLRHKHEDKMAEYTRSLNPKKLLKIDIKADLDKLEVVEE